MGRCFTNRHDFFDASKLFLDQQRGAVVAAEAFWLTGGEKSQWNSTEGHSTEVTVSRPAPPNVHSSITASGKPLYWDSKKMSLFTMHED